MSTPTEKPHKPVVSEVSAPSGEVGIMPMDFGIRTKLSIMMFLQYFAWGAWYVSLGGYVSEALKFTGTQQGWVYAASPIGAMVAPFFVGMVADRFFATQRILAALHIVGGIVLAIGALTLDFNSFFLVLLAFFLCYMPTLALTNSISFSHMSNPERQFPGIRVLGTIGWIVAGQLIGYLGVGNTPMPMYIGAGTFILLGFFCLTLPNTPPSNPGGRVDVRTVLGLDSLRMMKQWSFAVFVLGSFLICIPLQFYYSFALSYLDGIGMTNAVGKMTYGQVSEIFFMLIMPWFFLHLGVKYMLLVGMLAWAVRYLLFSFGNVDDRMWMLYGGIVLHGICYDFFFVTGYIYVDKKAPEAIRASAQGFIAFITWGVGGFIGSNLAGLTADYYTNPDGARDWHGFWLAPAIASAVVMVLFAFAFRDKVEVAPKTV